MAKPPSLTERIAALESKMTGQEIVVALTQERLAVVEVKSVKQEAKIEEIKTRVDELTPPVEPPIEPPVEPPIPPVEPPVEPPIPPVEPPKPPVEPPVEPPVVVPPTTDPPPPVVVPPSSGTTRYVRSGESIQAAIDAATGPCEIRIQTGAIFNENLTLRKKNLPPDQYIVLRPDAVLPSSPDHPWVDPMMAGAFARLQAADPYRPTLSAEDGAYGYWLMGLEGLPNLTHPEYDMFVIGRSDITALSQAPHHIAVDRCYLHGDPTKGQHRGLMFNVANGSVLKSYFGNFIERGRDSQAICVLSGPGPFLIAENYLEATGENFLVGGGDPRISGLVPADFTIRGNWFNKPMGWKGTTGGSVKNLFELKNAARVLIEGNLFTNSWVDAQSGHGVVITIRNQDGSAPWSVVKDVIFRGNAILNCEGAFLNLLGQDYLSPSEQGTNLTIENNFMQGAAMGIQTSSGFRPTIIKHNTLIGLQWKLLQFSGNLMPPGSLTFQDNVASATAYGIMGDGAAGMPSGAIFVRNVIEKNDGYNYPTDNYVLSNGQLAARLDAQGNYTGTGASTDGKKLGADVTAIRASMPWWK